ncbi:hypothetical protein BC940DRAFT_269781 [Gongronella butleri]|nr:hypothetical protein BC940DRAFT_269781 [Gongronella butleri]
MPVSSASSVGGAAANNSNSSNSNSNDAGAQPRKRTRATPEQLAVLEKTFSVNPSPNNRVREQLSRDLGMSERSIQIWFQNRRAKVKNMAKRSSLLHDETLRMQYYAATAAAAACQAASLHQQHTSPDGTPVANPDLYYYYYYYYYNQQQQQQQAYYASCDPNHVFAQKPLHQATPPPPPPMPSTTTTPTGTTPTGSKLPWQQTPPSSVSPSHMTQMPHPLPHSAASNAVSRVGTPPVPAPSASAASVSSAGRVRSHSVGHYPYHHPYQRAQMRPTSSTSTHSAAAASNHRRNYSSSPAPHHHPSAQPQFAMAPPPPPPQHTNAAMWASTSSSLMDHTILEETSGLVNATGAPTTASGLYTMPMIPMSMPGFLPDDRLGTPMSMDDVGPVEESYLSRISVEALQIGTWKRISLRPHDLECFFDRQTRSMLWRIQDGQQRFKMHLGLDMIDKMQLDALVDRAGWARLTVTVTQPEAISFYMEDLNSQQGGPESWTQCRDFTQDRQATSVRTHTIDGPVMALRTEWFHLIATEPHLKALFIDNLPANTAITATNTSTAPSASSSSSSLSQQPTNSLPVTSAFDTALGPHGQSMLGLSSREVTPADVMMALHDNESMLQLMEKDKDQDTQDLLLFQGV